MAKLFDSGTNKKVTGKAADSGYNAMQTTPKLQVQLPNLQNLFQSNTAVTGKAADSNYTGSKTASSLPRVQTPARQTTTQNLGTTATPKQVTGKAADSGYTPVKKQASQAANRQTVQNWWKQPKRRLRRMKRGCFEEAARLADMKCPGIVTPRRCSKKKKSF